MAIILFLLTIALGIFMLIGFFSPETSLFWMSKNKTKLKSFLIYGISAFFVFIIFVISLPAVDKTDLNTKNAPINDEIRQQNEEKLNENVVEWFELSSKKKEKFTKKNILGTWYQIQLISNYEEEKINFSSNKKYQSFYKNKGDYVSEETYIEKDGFFDFPHITTVVTDDSGKNERKGSWIMDDGKLSISFLVEKDNYNVIYLSDKFLVKSLTKPLSNSESWEIYTNQNGISEDELVQANVNSEFTDLYKHLFTKSVTGFLKAIEEIKTSNNEKAYQRLISNYKDLGMTIMMSDDNIEELELVKNLPNEIGESYKIYSKQKIDEFSNTIKELENYNEGKYFLEKYNNEIEKINLIALIGNTFNLDNKEIKKQIVAIENDYDKRINEFNIYGNMSETLMEIVAENYIKNVAKDPSSIKFIENKQIGKTKSGIKYFVKYRGKNSFGAYDISSNVLLLKWNSSSDIYEVVDIN